jgi:uncharacterized protein YjbJ (UPF0337 family)
MIYQEERRMDKSAGKQVSGSIRQTIGKDDIETEAERAASKTAGQTEKDLSGAHDKVRDEFND